MFHSKKANPEGEQKKLDDIFKIVKLTSVCNWMEHPHLGCINYFGKPIGWKELSVHSRSYELIVPRWDYVKKDVY